MAQHARRSSWVQQGRHSILVSCGLLRSQSHSGRWAGSPQRDGFFHLEHGSRSIAPGLLCCNVPGQCNWLSGPPGAPKTCLRDQALTSAAMAANPCWLRAAQSLRLTAEAAEPMMPLTEAPSAVSHLEVLPSTKRKMASVLW